MNTGVWLARILSIGGVLETGVGLMLLVDPSALVLLLLRAALDGAGLVVARLGGGGLLALGIACWGARRTPLELAGLAAARAFLAYNIIACVTLALARPALADGGFPALAAAVAHGVLGAALLALLFRSRGPSVGP